MSDRNAELALCGSALLDEGVLDAVDVAPEQFVDVSLRQVWSAMVALRNEGVALDEITVADRAGVAAAVIGECAVATPTSQNAEHYANIVREYALTRQVLAVLAELHGEHRAGRAIGKELLDAALARITAIDVGRPTKAVPIGQVLRDRMRELDELAAARQRGAPALTGVPTGIKGLDDILGGYQRGIVTVVAGRPAMGKSAFALAACHAASAQGYGVHVFSLEDSRSAYADRVLSQRSEVPAEAVRAGRLSRDDLLAVATASRDLMKRQNWVYEDASAAGAEDIVRAVRRERVRNGTQLVVVDYLQILRRPRRYDNANDAIEQQMNILADAAAQDGIAYLVLSQLTRDVERRQDKRPQLSDLRGSGAIEQRAKCALGLYRGSYYGDPQKGIDYEAGEPEPSGPEWEGRLDVLVLKNNNGQAGTYVRCRWDGPTTRVYT